MRLQVKGLDASEAAAAEVEMEKAKEAALRLSRTSLRWLQISGAEGYNANFVNGVYKIIDKQADVVYMSMFTDAEKVYLYLSVTGQWYVSGRENKDARKNAGWAHSEAMTVCSSPVDAQQWRVFDGKDWQEQSVRVRFEAFGLFWSPRGPTKRPRSI